MNVDIFVRYLRDIPGMVMTTDKHRFHRLQAFISGIKWARDLSKSDVDEFLKYEVWLNMKLVGNDNTVAWFDNLMRAHSGDEDKALTAFFAHWEEFRASGRQGDDVEIG